MAFDKTSPVLLCSVCDGRLGQVPVVICTECANPNRVRTYCASCGHRGDYSLSEARKLFEDTGLCVDQVGVVYLFEEGCGLCNGASTFPIPLRFDLTSDRPVVTLHSQLNSK